MFERISDLQEILSSSLETVGSTLILSLGFILTDMLHLVAAACRICQRLRGSVFARRFKST